MILRFVALASLWSGVVFIVVNLALEFTLAKILAIEYIRLNVFGCRLGLFSEFRHFFGRSFGKRVLVFRVLIKQGSEASANSQPQYGLLFHMVQHEPAADEQPNDHRHRLRRAQLL